MLPFSLSTVLWVYTEVFWQCLHPICIVKAQDDCLEKKEILPRDWEQINVLPLVCFSYLKTKKKVHFNTNSDGRIYQNNSGLQHGKTELLEGFQIRATLIICFHWALQQEGFLVSLACSWNPGVTCKLVI